MSDEKRIAIGLKLKNTREYLGISQEESAKAANIPRSGISLIESGQRKIDSVELAALARLYQQPVGYFLEDQDPVNAGSELEFLARNFSNLSSTDKQELIRFAEFLAMRERNK